MSTTISIEEAQARLPELIAKLAPGDELVITQGSRPVAELRPSPGGQPKPQFGRCKGMLTIVEDD
ncbi:MAG TPA: hypothetical protein VGX76_19465, partial [Pirellulales bacterium]|nr:hypothetical protein [Pirellulales bacterium]